MIEDRMARLLDQAVPGIPEDLRRPPLTELRARVRRRRIRRTAVAVAGVTLVLMTGPALWYASDSGSRRTVPDVADGPSALADDRLTWWMARVGRDDRTVTLYVSRLSDAPPCQGTWQPEATVVSSADAVTVEVADGSATGIGCADDDTRLAPVRVTLPEPLDRRDLVDAYDDGSRPVYREADLPEVPGGVDGWSEVRTSFSAPAPVNAEPPGAWLLSYTRPGGPDIRIRGYPAGHALAAVPAGDPVDTVEVAGTRGRIDPYGGDRFLLRWQVSDTVYLLDVLPSEGVQGSMTMFRDVLERIGVS
ncbi:hypothetical protein [Plantactinospora sonchi]|uniref:DUF5642 domain-containing protein n=1 Tax=Plantactinospora sonchi TaxID=1544735 RepID=A0ABU7RSK4_9ACTN